MFELNVFLYVSKLEVILEWIKSRIEFIFGSLNSQVSKLELNSFRNESMLEFNSFSNQSNLELTSFTNNSKPKLNLFLNHLKLERLKAWTEVIPEWSKTRIEYILGSLKARNEILKCFEARIEHILESYEALIELLLEWAEGRIEHIIESLEARIERLLEWFEARIDPITLNSIVYSSHWWIASVLFNKNCPGNLQIIHATIRKPLLILQLRKLIFKSNFYKRFTQKAKYSWMPTRSQTLTAIFFLWDLLKFLLYQNWLRKYTTISATSQVY